ncbi:hypothetical protein [Microbacterium ulmi]|uniref:Imidazolonepropionase-like amidohydrolase n=1 Tax=Microbacterium ulmi TaxID=179095 RepID=A0A7Y2LZR2_9MICO|nr:hypothetical protein [Microbacterium ulmi]NII69721.1 hypothetical protein [Microbacterium ulmi]NNH03304.1 hypothetical protein [Microbacterium ulmi]
MTHIDPFALRDLVGQDAAPCRRALTGEHGVALPPFVDHHVHLHLIDAHALPAGGIAGVLDLGGDPVALARLPKDGFPRVAYAGAILTAPGGYPIGRPWAPAEIAREVSDATLHAGAAGGAATAVDEQAVFGASVVKVALNAAAGPVLDPATLSAVVAAARTRGRPVVAHVEGMGMARRALDAGVDALAHAPFSETLSPAEIGEAVASGQRWIPTVAIHGDGDRERAIANLAAFVAAGGAVLYGTDLGNGERVPGVQVDELSAMDAAGLRGAALVAALTDPWPRREQATAIATFIPGPAPRTLDEVPAWLSRATVVPDEELIRDDV